MISDRTDHNRFAAQFAARLSAPDAGFVETRLRELAAFERRARGEPTAVTAASVAQQEQPAMSNVASLLQTPVPSSAYLKMGTLGFQGGGKTLTSAKVLIGLYQHTLELGIHDGSKPVAMFDTEKGSDWLIPMFKKAGVPFVVAKRKAFADLLKVMDDAEKSAFGLLIDSITHPWRELVESYLRKKERSYLAMDDWGYLKGEHGWQQFTDRYVNSKLHIVMAGRAGHEYENYVEDGRKKMEKVGTKMKTEGETGYEPDLLVLMEQVEDLRTGKVVHRATVQKDRSQLLDGQQFDNPDFSDFLPHIGCLALGAAHVGVGVTGDSQHLLKVEKRDWTPVQREICIDEIQTLLSLHFPSQTADDKKNKLKSLLAHFDATWTEIEKVMPLPDLRTGYDSLHVALEGKPSKYSTAIAKDAQTNDINDSLPDFAARDLKPTAELLASRLVVEAGKNPAPEPVDTTTVSENGIPAFLDRTARPAAPAFDESKWLAELTNAFNDCIDFVSFGEKQMKLMLPVQSQVTADTWKKGMKLASRCIARITKHQTSGAMTVAAE